MVMTQSHKDAIKKGVQSYHACAKSHGCGKGNKAKAKKPVKKEVKKVVKKPVEKPVEKDEPYLKEQQQKLDKFIDESNNPKIKSFKGIGKSNQVFNVKLKDNDVTFTYRDKGTNKVKKVSFIFKVKEKAVAKPVKKAEKPKPKNINFKRDPFVKSPSKIARGIQSPEIFKDNIKSPPRRKFTEEEKKKPVEKAVKKPVEKAVKKPVEKAESPDLDEEQKKLDKLIDESNNAKFKSQWKGQAKDNKVFNVKLKNNKVTFTWRMKGTDVPVNASYTFQLKKK